MEKIVQHDFKVKQKKLKDPVERKWKCWTSWQIIRKRDTEHESMAVEVQKVKCAKLNYLGCSGKKQKCEASKLPAFRNNEQKWYKFINHLNFSILNQRSEARFHKYKQENSKSSFIFFS